MNRFASETASYVPSMIDRGSAFRGTITLPNRVRIVVVLRFQEIVRSAGTTFSTYLSRVTIDGVPMLNALLEMPFFAVPDGANGIARFIEPTTFILDSLAANAEAHAAASPRAAFDAAAYRAAIATIKAPVDYANLAFAA